MKRIVRSLGLTCLLFAATAAVANAQKVYWREGRSPTVIKRANLDGSALEELVTIPTTVTKSFGLALDLDGGKMYWAEREEGKIRRANLDGTSPQDVLTGLSLPLHVALDIAGDRMYWTQDEGDYLEGVYRARLNGADAELLNDSNWWDAALDLSGQKMYLTRTAGLAGPSVANLNGTGLQQLLGGISWFQVFGNSFALSIALDVDGGKMYFSTQGFSGGSASIGRADLDGSDPEQIAIHGPLTIIGAIALDVGAGKIYWTEINPPAQYEILRSNLDGSGSEVLFETAGMPYDLALDLRPEPAIPAMSSWALAILVLMLTTAATLVLWRRQTAQG